MRSPTEPPAADDELNPSTEVHPIRFMQIGGVPDLPVPLARVSTCGEMRLLVVHEVTSTNPPLARYRLVQSTKRRKGSSTALNLLKMLVSVPGHVASRDWLSEHLARQRASVRGREEEDEDLEAGFGRVDNVVSLLRSLLCPDGIEGKKHLRALLLEWQRNHRESGSSYQLAGAPLIWIDVDDIARFTKRASKQEQEGQDALASWERVYELAHKGTYLAQEMYSDWAVDRRAEIDGCLKQAVLALQRLYLQRDGDAGEERVLLLLREYWQQHPTNEDIFRPLLEVLNRRHRMQEGLDYYQQLCQRLAEEGQTPDQRTQDMAQSISERRITLLGDSETKRTSHPEMLSFPSQQKVLFEFQPLNNQDIMLERSTLERLNIDTMDSAKREFLRMLGTSLVFAQVSNDLYSFVQTMVTGDQMALLETEIAARWKVYHTGNTLQAHQGFSLWLPEIERYAKKVSSHIQYSRATTLLSLSYQLQGSIFRDEMDYSQAHISYNKAFLIADASDNEELKSSALARRGVTFIQQHKPIEAIQYLESALLIIDVLDLPSLKCYIFQALSEAYAMAHLKSQSQKYTDSAEQTFMQKRDTKEVSNCQLNTTSIAAQKGVNLVLMQDYTHALDLLNEGLSNYSSSLLRGRARLLAQKAEAYYGLRYISESVSTALDAFTIANSINSQKTIKRVESLYAQMDQSSYGKERSVLQLGKTLAIE